MKKIFILFICSVTLIGCANEKEKKIDENTKVDSALVESKNKKEEIINLLKADGVNDVALESESNDKLVFRNDNCQIIVNLEDNKTTSISSKLLFDDSDYSCVFRTLVKDKDLLGSDKVKFEEYMQLFREKENFSIDGIKVKRSEVDIEFIKEK